MAILPTLGTGLFIGSGQALATGGPLSLLLSYGFLSLMIYCIGTAIAEVASHMPMKGGTLVNHNYRYSSSTHTAFSISYVRWYTLAMMVPFEITNAIVNLGFFEPDGQVAIRVSIMAVIVIALNLLPKRSSKTMDTVFGFTKLVTTFWLFGLSIAMVIRGVPKGEQGFHFWVEPGFMKEYVLDGRLGRLLGLVQCLLFSTVSFTMVPELIVQRAEERDRTKRRSVLKVAQHDSMYLSAVYMLSVTAFSMVCPYDHPLLTAEGRGAGLSPILVAVEISKFSRFPALRFLVTLAILLSSLSSARSFLSLSSSTLSTLSGAGHAPPMFHICNRLGVPYVSVLSSGLFAAFAYLSVIRSSALVFNWLMHFVTTCGYISLVGSCMVYFRFRKATKAQGFTRAHQTRIQPFGAYFGVIISTALQLTNGLIEAPEQGFPSNALAANLGTASFWVLYFGHRLNTVLRKDGSQRDPSKPRLLFWRWERPEQVSRAELGECDQQREQMEQGSQMQQTGQTEPLATGGR